MSKIHHLYPNWLSKSALAHKLGVSERTIYARWKRGELLRQEIDGEILWAEIPEEGRKEAEEIIAFLGAHGTPPTARAGPTASASARCRARVPVHEAARYTGTRTAQNRGWYTVP